MSRNDDALHLPGVMDATNPQTTPKAFVIATVAAAAVMAAAPVAAQTMEATAGVQGVFLRLPAVGERPAGFGLRATVDMNRIGLDGELSAFPANPSGNFGERLWLAGARVRLLGGRSRLFARARAGRIAFNGSFFDGRLDDRRHAAYDVGVSYERAGSSAFIRIDVGDLIVPFGGATYSAGPQPQRLGVSHNVAAGVGFGLRLGR